MGVSITAYGTATRVLGHNLPLRDGVPVYTDAWYDEHDGGETDHVVAFCYLGHEQSLTGLVAGACYEVSESMDMLSRSYHGYGWVRDHLSRGVLGVPAPTVWADVDAYRDQPLFEIIHFADNEGCIGPVACSRLAEDFEQHRDRFHAYVASVTLDHDDTAWAREDLATSYDALAAGFVHAAGSGLVNLS